MCRRSRGLFGARQGDRLAAGLAVDAEKRLKSLTEQFLAEKEFSAAGGLTLDDEICVSIAVQGGLPVLELGLSAYRGWVGIVVYPDEFIVQRRIEDEDGIVHEYDDVRSGEAWEGGPLVISWHDVQLAGQADTAGYNVVIHEFAHKLDMLNGEADGIPALHSGLDEEGGIAIFDAAFEDFCQRVDADEETVIDPYASQDHSEFFAVISEVFFLLAIFGRSGEPRLRYWVRVREPLGDAPWLHQAALGYLSDFWFPMAALATLVDVKVGTGLYLASLNHTLWFHRALCADEWLLGESGSPFAGHSRGLSQGLVWRGDGALVATIAQEALFRGWVEGVQGWEVPGLRSEAGAPGAGAKASAAR